MNFSNRFIGYFIFFLIILFLLYSRFMGLDWGLPYPMHPDERNMVVAITQLTCPKFGAPECFNPHFFAYGQLPLYLAYLLQFIVGIVYKSSSYVQAAIALRIIAAMASIGTIFFLIKTIRYFVRLNVRIIGSSLLLFISVPAFIQFAHFGTTESLLMFLYSVLIYLAVRFISLDISLRRFSSISGMILGIALGTKVSALTFGIIPFVALVYYVFREKKISWWIQTFFEGIKLSLFAFVFFIITSPYNFIALQDFIGAMQYESDVGLGEYRAFYTRQFEYSLPFIFQFVKIFPYSLGSLIFILFIGGFFLLPFNKTYNFVRIQFLLFFIPNAIIYAKWTRFISPVFPLMVLISFLMVMRLYQFLLHYVKGKLLSQTMIILVLLLSVIPGIAYTTMYVTKDVRYEASKWVYEHIPNNAYILSETANVIDVPIPDPTDPDYANPGKYYTYISFNLYDMNLNPDLSEELEDHIRKADYIFVPSRRVFSTHTCYEFNSSKVESQNVQLAYQQDRCAQLLRDYPEVNAYYDRLFSGNLGFEKVAEFSSYPRIELFGYTLFEFPDEMAEETWTVFDHPVMRIYKRV